MKVCVLLDNRILDADLETEHGLSVFLESKGQKWLLDTGRTDKFIRNASSLGVDIRDIDYVFISHGHSDHIGGLPAFFQMNEKAKVVVSTKALSQTFYSVKNGLKSISIDFDFRPYWKRFCFVDEFVDFGGGVYVFPCKEGKYALPKGNNTLYKTNENGLRLDDFDHELVVCFDWNGLLVYTGCAHHGIRNILDLTKRYFSQPITHVVGGFHLLDRNDRLFYETDEELDEIGKALKTEYPDTQLFTGHCTGNIAYRRLKAALGPRINPFYTGFSLEA